MAGERRPVREHTAEQEEYRRRQEAKAKRRRKQQMNRLLLLLACVLGVVLLVVVIVNIFKAILNPDKTAGKSSSVTSSSSMTLSEADSILNGGRPMAENPEAWNLLVINNQSKMPDGFAPETVSIDNIGHTVDARIAEPLKDMITACNTETGNALAVASAERGPQTQNGNYQRLVDQFKAEGKSETEADALARKIDPPYGYSDHQTALAVDFVTATVGAPSNEFATTPEFAWLQAHAAEYGFVLRFPESKAAITGIDYQPYHFRYVGSKEAAEMVKAGICLEEYVAVEPVAQPPASNTGEGAEPDAAEESASASDISEDSSKT